MKSSTRVLLIAMMCVAVAACSKKVKDEQPADTTGSETSGPSTTPSTGTVTGNYPTRSGAYGPGDLDTDACLRQRVIYFDFDQDALRSEFQSIVACHAKYLRDRPSARMSLEAHADERGSREYNHALSERRGNSVSSAVQANGGSAGQISVVAYGEEQPVCTDSNEDCWARNRRAEIVYTAK